MATTAEGILMLGAGLGLMGFGLLLFYTFLPLFYGLFGAGLGYWLGLTLTGRTVLTAGMLEFSLAIIGGVAFAAAAYWLEPVRRILAGLQVGALAGFVLGYFLDIGTLADLALAVAGASLGVFLARRYFDPMIVAISAFTGAAMTMDGAHILMPGLRFLDRQASFAQGGLVRLLIWLVVAAAGGAWQYTQLRQWSKTAAT